ncbi:RNA methyltransferase [Tuanshanicoccus lijuaniae]|uniref:TrmH family RNA methyltransferase n=1 Tax=Aerococcaceae bacterium zg-1292 TaxID=2774330 RepID=UPI001936599A|nr:RNA methyltransferase [Aerococcaceae bacterium zg-1292]QQA36654.1 RNA methyltransferase [Aerococcaceae bacterium zg-1292]
MMKAITSKQNSQLKDWHKLLTSKGRKKAQAYLVEGEHLVEEAVKSNQTIRTIIVSQQYVDTHDVLRWQSACQEMVLLANHCVDVLSQTQQSQGVFAVVEMVAVDKLPQVLRRVLIVDAVQDPGNLGTIIRTADAADYDAVILGDGTVDLYNDKVLRATQGSLWHLPVVSMPVDTAVRQLKQQGFTILATALHQAAQPYHNFTALERAAIIVGNEGQGVAQRWIEQADASVYIPMSNRVESLNVAIAAAILMFQLK